MMEQHNLIKETALFLGNGTEKIYCVEYLPSEELNLNHGVILCRSIWGVRNRAHRIFTNLARELAGKGYSVITCDYYGDGNSQGRSQDMAFDVMIDNLVMIHDYLLKKCNIESLSVIGFRIGANCAAELVKRIGTVNKIILIEPELNLIDYLKKKLRSNLSTQMATYKEIRKNREALIQDIKNNIPVNIDGVMLGKSLYESFERSVGFSEIGSDYQSVLILCLVENGKTPVGHKKIESISKNISRCTVEMIDKEFYWHDWKSNTPFAPLLFQKVFSYLISK